VAFRGQEYPFSYLRSPEISIDLGLFQHPARQAACYNQIRWLELQLGRLPQSLEWHQLYTGVTGVLTEKGLNTAKFSDNAMRFDTVLTG
jgi:hypothetical protein